MKVGFIGQGFIGGAYARDFEERGFEVVRYALEEPYVHNKDHIKECEVVFIAVPTPTIEDKFDDSVLREVIGLVGEGKVAVIKSTVLPGTTESLQEQNPKTIVLHSPEFLREKTAHEDAAHPARNILGIPIDSEVYRAHAQKVLDILPHAPFSRICMSRESELVKYIGNVFLYMKVVYANLVYDLAENIGADWNTIRDCVIHDPRIGTSHFDPVHASGISDHMGRGAGGHCFIKDFAAFSKFYHDKLRDTFGDGVFEGLKRANNHYLVESGKDIDLLEQTYGADVSRGL